MTELELRDLRKTYRARGRPAVEAVRGLDLALRSGELLGLLGPSGCGKSTTLRMIAGLETVTGGDILVAGSSLVGRPAQQRNIGVAFENYALYPPLTVAGNLAFGLRARGRAARKDVERKVADIAERFGSQCCVASVDARRVGERWEVFTHGGRRPTGLDAIDHALHLADLGAGELLVTSMDRDGTRSGYDNDLIRAISDAVPIPVIASGGVGGLDDLVAGVKDGHASAVLAASIFHFGEHSIGDAKRHMVAAGIPMRLSA